MIPGSAFFSSLHCLSFSLAFFYFSCIYKEYVSVWGCKKCARVTQVLIRLCVTELVILLLSKSRNCFPDYSPIMPGYNWPKTATLQGRNKANEISIIILWWSDRQRVNDMCPFSPGMVFLITLSRDLSPPLRHCSFRNNRLWEKKVSPDVSMDTPYVQINVLHCSFFLRSSGLHTYVSASGSTNTSLSELQFPLLRLHFLIFSLFVIVALFVCFSFCFVFETRSYVWQAALDLTM